MVWNYELLLYLQHIEINFNKFKVIITSIDELTVMHILSFSIKLDLLVIKGLNLTSNL